MSRDISIPAEIKFVCFPALGFQGRRAAGDACSSTADTFVRSAGAAAGGNASRCAFPAARERRRRRIAANYNIARVHKALASLRTVAHTFFWSGKSTANNAEFVAREACDLEYNAACVSIAVDDALKTRDPAGISNPQLQRLLYFHVTGGTVDITRASASSRSTLTENDRTF